MKRNGQPPDRRGVRALALSACTAVLAIGASAALLSTGGCSPANDSGRGVPDAAGRTFARLAVVLTAPRDGAVTVDAAGRLVRYRGVDLDGAQVLAGATDRERAPLGRCAILDEESLLEDALATSPPDAVVQMLDAGDLLVRVAGQTVKMAPRYVPDILPFVSGVVYDGEVAATEGDPLAAAATSTAPGEAWIAAFGGQQVGRFVTGAEVPAMPRFLTLAGAAPEAPAALDPGADLPLTWTGDPAGRGTVLVTVARDSGPTLRCRVPDAGRFTIPAAALARVLDGTREGGVAVAVERSRRSPFSAAGVDSAEVEVTARDVVTLRSY